MLVCKGICDSLITYDRYEGDYKYCTICAVHIEIKGKPRCPCCHVVMRSKPRKNKYQFKNKTYFIPRARY